MPSELEDTAVTLIRTDGSGELIEVVAVGPSGLGFKVQVGKKKQKAFRPAQVLTGYADANTGEIISDGGVFARSLWFDAVVKRRGAFYLENAIQALPIDGIGLVCAIDVASTMRTWKTLLDALSQLEHYEIPSDRDELDLVIGFADAGYPELPPAPPFPLRTLFETPGIGIARMRKIQAWVRSDRSVDDVRTVESLGAIGDFQGKSL